MNELLNTLHNVNQSLDPFLGNFQDSREIQEITERLDRSIQHCFSEAYQSLSKQKRLIYICLKDLDYAQILWENQVKMLEIPSSQIIEEIGKLSGSLLNITKLTDESKKTIFLKLKETWESELEQLKKIWFFNKEGKMKQGVGWNEKEGFIKGIEASQEHQARIFSHYLLPGFKLIEEKFNRVINWSTIESYITLLDPENKNQYRDEIQKNIDEVNNITKNTNQYIKSFDQEVISPLGQITSHRYSFGDLTLKGDLTWEQVKNTSSKYILNLEIFLEYLLTNLNKKITECFEKVLRLYDIFLHKQKCYQEEKPEQLELKQQWTNIQRTQLENLQKSIEEILSQNST